MKLIIFFITAIFICSNAVAKKPNYILVFIDDMGWGDFSCFGNEHAKTPTLMDWRKRGLGLSNSM